MSSSNCCFLTCIQISRDRSGGLVLLSLKDFPQFIVIHTVKDFGTVNKTEVDAFLELSCFFGDPTDVGNLIFGSSAFSTSILNIWKLMVHVLLNPGLENFECVRWVQLYSSLNIIWHCLSLGLTFSSPVATAEFSKFVGMLSAALSQHHLSGFEIAQLEFHHFH